MFEKLDPHVDIAPFEMQYLNSVHSSNICDNMQNFQALSTGMKTAVRLSSRKIRDFGIDGLVRLLSYSSNLKIFCFSKTKISVRHSSRVIDCLSGLQCIHLIEINFESFSTLVDMQLWKVCEHHRQLTKLNLFGCVELTDVGLHSVSTFCLTLKWLNVGKLVNLTDNCLFELGEKCCHLSNIFFGQSKTLFSDGGLHCLFSKRAELLVEIDISGILRHGLVTAIGNECHNLTSLNLSGSMVILEPGIEAICVGCKQITALNVSNMSNLELSHILRLFSSLELLAKFTFSGVAGELSSSVYHALSHKFQFITYLDIIGDCVEGVPLIQCHDEMMNMLHQEIIAVKTSEHYYTKWYKDVSKCVSFVSGKCCGSLKSLSVSGNLALHALLTLSHPITEFNLLTSLTLVELTCLSDDDLDALSHQCCNLLQLNIKNCPLISSEGIISFCTRCVSIEHFVLHGFHGEGYHEIICDKAFSIGISCLKNLKRLRLAFLSSVTEVGFRAVAHGCKKLHNDVEVFKCGVDQALVDAIFV
jgi:hypothetical protein